MRGGMTYVFQSAELVKHLSIQLLSFLHVSRDRGVQLMPTEERDNS